METEAWKHGDIDIEIWKHGEMETWRHGDMGHGDIKHKTVEALYRATCTRTVRPYTRTAVHDVRTPRTVQLNQAFCTTSTPISSSQS